MTADAPNPATTQSSKVDKFWCTLVTLFIGFALPVLACYGLILTSVLAINLLATSSGFASPDDLGGADAVALIRVQGVIVSSAGPFDTGIAAADRIIGQLEQAAGNDNVKAVLLAVNSPGGGVNASDRIHHAITELDKPVVVMMSDLAASGGYYISAPADWIIANPNTLTGSIGVISQFINVDELLQEYGVDVVVVTSGPRKDFGSPFRDMTDEERAYWQETTDEIYDSFVEIIVAGRTLDEDTVLELADGSVYTGRQALENGLVDALGYEEDAIAKAAELGGITGEPRVIEMQTDITIEDFLTGLATRSYLPNLAEVLNLIGHPTLEARWLGP